jgi:coatomer subunit beta'
LYRYVKERASFRPHFAAEGLHGGVLMGLRSTDFICFYDWQESRVIRRIDVAVKDVWWSDSGGAVQP